MNIDLYKNFPIQNYVNEVFYSNILERNTDFAKKVDLHIENISDIDMNKKEIVVEMEYVNLSEYNYMTFNLKGLDYFCFINNINWHSNLVTATIKFDIDYWQTYCYDIDFQNCFIEREHVYNDDFGQHIIEENLPVDEYITQFYIDCNGENDGMYFCIATTDVGKVLTQELNGWVAMPSISKPSKYEQSILIIFDDDMSNINSVIAELVTNGKSDGICGLYAVPKVAIPSKISKKCYLTSTEIPLNYVITNNDELNFLNTIMPKPKNIQNYVPHNSKCFTYPYCFVNITNNNGNSIKAQFEKSQHITQENNQDVFDYSIEFNYYFPCIEGSTSFGFLKNYSGVEKNFSYSIQGNTNIELPFITNTFSAYMSANQNSISNQYKQIERNEQMSTAKNVLNTSSNLINSAIQGNVGGLINGAINGGLNQADIFLNSYNQRESIDASLKDMSIKPDIAHGSFIANGNILSGKIGYTMELITVTNENIQMIDSYFDMYGYKVNRLGTPHLFTRPYFNYIKTSGCNLLSLNERYNGTKSFNVPNFALNIIKNMFDNGSTLWHKLDYMYKYTEYSERNRPNGKIIHG